MDKKLIEKIIKQDDEEIIEDILRGNGFKEPMVKYKDYGKGKKRYAILTENTVYDIKVDGTNIKVDERDNKPENKPKPEKISPQVKEEIPKNNVEKYLEEQGKKPYVGDSSKLHGKVVKRDANGKPVYDSFMQNEGSRIDKLLRALAALETDERDRRPMTQREAAMARSINTSHRRTR